MTFKNETISGERHVVGVADMQVSGSVGDVIITHALGSCLGIAIHDPVAKVGGLLHVMLPQSSIDPIKATKNPYMFVDTGVPLLFKECYRLGATKERLVIKVAGGAAVHNEEKEDFFQIGKRNFVILRKLLWKNGVMIKTQDVGGRISRTMSMEIGEGEVTIASRGKKTSL